MRVFVTGSTGLLGNNIVRTLLADGHEVLGLTRSAEKFERMLGDTAAVPVQGDLREVDGFVDRFEGCDAVFHTAAYFREYYQRGDHAEALRAINIDATLALMAAADERGVKAFVHTSSSGTIGIQEDGTPGDEDTPPSAEQLTNLYFKSKHDGDAEIRAWEPQHGLRVIEILPGWMFGPGDAGPTSAGQLVLDFLAGKLPAVPEGGTCVVDARDVARAAVDAVDQPHGERFCVAGRYLSLRDVIDAFAEASGTRAPSMDLPLWLAKTYAKMNEAWAGLTGGRASASYEGVKTLGQKHRIDSAKAERVLGATFRPFAQTAADVLAWYAADGRVDAAATLASRAEPLSAAGTRGSA